MANTSPNLFTRQDTILGICEAVGQDFGFNPTWLRLALVAPLFFFPVQTFAAYFGLGVIVLVSRFAFPDKSVAEPVIVEATTETKVQPAEAAETMALAA